MSKTHASSDDGLNIGRKKGKWGYSLQFPISNFPPERKGDVDGGDVQQNKVDGEEDEEVRGWWAYTGDSVDLSDRQIEIEMEVHRITDGGRHGCSQVIRTYVVTMCSLCYQMWVEEEMKTTREGWGGVGWVG
ncbi:hypothetical protein L1987_61997 [Smallanthus sonchifolius]|uniref:Uncharacterized protein n=1 Tax=Smallanthus sonchifolius TaxID=185202 RepID=A0ACB9C950_9ASTR|nr:hypothetical protein L1987_61997 [Smallanthus sonchifolius]